MSAIVNITQEVIKRAEALSEKKNRLKKNTAVVTRRQLPCKFTF